MSDAQNNATPTSATADADLSAGEAHADPASDPSTVPGDVAEAPAPEETADYEAAFHEMYEHATGQAKEISDLKVAAERSTADLASAHEQFSQQTAAIADLHEQLDAMSSSLGDFRNSAVVQQQKLDDKTSECSSLTKALADADAQIAETRRQRAEFKLWAVRVAGDKSDRMVLAEDGGKAHDKVPGAERIVLAAPTLVW